MLNINIRIADRYPLGDDDVRRLMSGTTLALTEAFAIDPETTVVRVEEADSGLWAVGGQPIGAVSNRATQIDIFLTKGSASPKQMKAAMAAMTDVVSTVFGGWVHDASTITIHEVASNMRSSYGAMAASSSDIKAVA